MVTTKPTGFLNLSEIMGGWHIVNVSAGPSLEPIILSSERPLYTRVEDPIYIEGREEPVYYSRPTEFSSGHPNRYRIHQCIDELKVIEITEVGHFAHAQPLGCHRWLLVSSSTIGDSDKNACVYTTEGEPVEWFHAGVWPDYVQTTQNSQIWLGYRDEAIYKTHNRLGHNGVVCLSDTGKPILKYLELAKQHGLPVVDDCYAMNVVSNEEVWLYYYSDFPLVKLKNRELENIWRDIPIKGSGALAVWQDWVLLARTYASQAVNSRFNFFLLCLTTMQVKELQPVDENNQPIDFYKPTFGRGSRLYIVKEERLYWFDLQDIVQSL